MKELHVDWDKIDGEYREDPQFRSGLSVGYTNMINAMVPPIELEIPKSQSLNTHLPDLTDSKMTRPNIYENLQAKAKPDSHEDLQTKIRPDVHKELQTRIRPDITKTD